MLKRLSKNTKQDTPHPDMVKSNLFRRLNKQRATYSLGNGVVFADDGVDKDRSGAELRRADPEGRIFRPDPR